MTASRHLTGLFLGAGASYEAGMPLVWDLTAELKNWLTPAKMRDLNSGWRKQGGGHADAVIEDLISMLERADVHYESILGYMEAQFRRRGPLQQEYHRLYSWLVEIVYYLLYYRQVNNQPFLDKTLPLYNGFRTLAEENTPLWVFSLNHDVMIEAIAARLSIPIHCGFSNDTVTLPRRDELGKIIGELQAAVLTAHDIKQRGLYFPNPSKFGIHLLKIHGALDMFTFHDGGDMLKLIPNSSGQEGVIDVLRAANEELIYPALSGKVKVTNEIAYADHQGEMQFLRRSLLAGAFKFDERASQVLPQNWLSYFRYNLNFVSSLVCIGYGFGDNHINSILRSWLEASAERRLEIVSPGNPSIPPFLQHLSPHVTTTAVSATEYLDRHAGIKRSTIEGLEKQVRSMVRSRSKKEIKNGLETIVQQYQGKALNDLIMELSKLPIVDGGVDFSSIGDPVQFAQHFATEMKINDEDLLRRMIECFDAASNAGNN
jgi:hypothetical protein